MTSPLPSLRERIGNDKLYNLVEECRPLDIRNICEKIKVAALTESDRRRVLSILGSCTMRGHLIEHDKDDKVFIAISELLSDYDGSVHNKELIPIIGKMFKDLYDSRRIWDTTGLSVFDVVESHFPIPEIPNIVLDYVFLYPIGIKGTFPILDI